MAYSYLNRLQNRCWGFHKWDKISEIKQPCKNCNLVRVRVNGFSKWTSSWFYIKNEK